MHVLPDSSVMSLLSTETTAHLVSELDPFMEGLVPTTAHHTGCSVS